MILTFTGPKQPKIGDTIVANDGEDYGYTGTRFIVISNEVQEGDHFILKNSNEILVCSSITPKRKKVTTFNHYFYFDVEDCLKISEITHISQEPRCSTGYDDLLFNVSQCNNKPEKYLFGLPYCKICAKLQIEMHEQLSKL